MSNIPFNETTRAYLEEQGIDTNKSVAMIENSNLKLEDFAYLAALHWVIIIGLAALTFTPYIGWLFWLLIALTTISSITGLFKLFKSAGNSDTSKALLYWELTKIRALAEKRNIVPVSLDITNYISIGFIALCGMWYFAVIRLIAIAGTKVLEQMCAESAFKVSQSATAWAAEKKAQADNADKNTSEIGKVERI
ncbi:MAG: hypothetical protein CMF61_05945 [Magnetococcales bacterium]|nr:hypothetical protein [Magnetococcales bacterium]